ncbi:MAG: bifunctional riboflavin kinase/FAD synthetase [Blautia sp.]|jgi:riboflavin kinase/FMN adenylyltransferase
MDYRDNITDLSGFTQTAVTLGKFDGIHRGHKKLICRVLEKRAEGCETVIFAFDVSKHMLYTKQERMEQLARMGIDCLIECPLDEHIRHMRAEDFVRDILIEKLHVRHIVVGDDFHFGYERKGNPSLLEEMGKKAGFSVEILPKEMDRGREISSTYVREQLNEGNIPKVNELLGEVFHATGEVLHGRGLGHRKLLPTTNLVPPREKLLPPNGVYVTISDFGDKRFGGITNIGYKPTVGGEEFIGIETYLFHCNENLYGRKSKVYFLEFLRPERKFDSLEELKRQLKTDIAKGMSYFQKSGGQNGPFIL